MATVATPRRSAVRMIRRAISPRLAISILSNTGLHPEEAESRLRWDWRVERSREGKAKHIACLDRIDNPVIPESRSGKIGVAFILVFPPDRRLESLHLLWCPVRGIAVDGRQHGRGLFAAHHRDACIGPDEHEPGTISPPAHAIIPRPEPPAA